MYRSTFSRKDKEIILEYMKNYNFSRISQEMTVFTSKQIWQWWKTYSNPRLCQEKNFRGSINEFIMYGFKCRIERNRMLPHFTEWIFYMDLGYREIEFAKEYLRRSKFVNVLFRTHNNNSRSIISFGKDYKGERMVKRTRALLDKNKVLILRPNEKFLTWEITSAGNLGQEQRNLNPFQLFRLHYFKDLFNNSKHRFIKASKLNKINAEINEAWNDSEIIRQNYKKLALDTNPFAIQLLNGSPF